MLPVQYWSWNVIIEVYKNWNLVILLHTCLQITDRLENSRYRSYKTKTTKFRSTAVLRSTLRSRGLGPTSQVTGAIMRAGGQYLPPYKDEGDKRGQRK